MSYPVPYNRNVSSSVLYSGTGTGVKRFTLINEVCTMNKNSKAWETPKLVVYDTVVEATGDDRPNKCGSGGDDFTTQIAGTPQQCEPI